MEPRPISESLALVVADMAERGAAHTYQPPMSAWRSFRRLPVGLQAGLVVIWSVLLVLVLVAATRSDNTPTEPTWRWTAPNGVRYEVTDDEDTEFTGSLPTPVAIIDGMAGDCAALTRERDFWRGQANGSAGGDSEHRANAAAYAAYTDALIDQAPAGTC